MDPEEIINSLIETIWPLLDQGMTKDEVMAYVHNVMDAWEPEPEEE
jgi:hypothetical protein